MNPSFTSEPESHIEIVPVKITATGLGLPEEPVNEISRFGDANGNGIGQMSEEIRSELELKFGQWNGNGLGDGSISEP